MKIGNIQIRPEVNDVKYWAHLIAIGVVTAVGITWWTGGSVVPGMPLLISIGKLSVLIGIGDIFAHTVLGIN